MARTYHDIMNTFLGIKIPINSLNKEEARNYFDKFAFMQV